MNNWKQVNENLQEWRKHRTTPPNLELYKKIVSTVGLGKDIADVGCGQQHLKKCLPDGHNYFGIDPFPIVPNTINCKAEDLINKYDTVFMLASLDNVESVKMTLLALRNSAKINVVILTGIDIPVDKYHTHTITKEVLYKYMGKPLIEKEMLRNVYLFEWLV
jgi:hypothetical protein